MNKLRLQVKTAAAYGKGNYVCLKRVSENFDEPEFSRLDQFARRGSGRWEDLRGPLPKGYMAGAVDECTGRGCPHWGECGYVKDRAKVRDADIVVTNHWLVGYHTRQLVPHMSYSPLMTGTLGTFDILILDEAHKFEEALRDSYSTEMPESRINAVPMSLLLAHDRIPIINAWKALFNSKVAPEAGIGTVITQIKSVFHPTLPDTAYAALLAIVTELEAAIKPEHVSSVQDKTLTISPLDLHPMYKELYRITKSVIYISATLAINNSFDVFKDKCGLDTTHAVTERVFPSTFDYSKQALLYLSQNVPEPSREEDKVLEYRTKLADEIERLLTANNGNAFVLFTARDELTAVYNQLVPRLSNPILSQHLTGPKKLLETFRATPNAILFGLKSFWEGIDVQGEKLSLVIITKLPFPQRSDPVLEARRAKAGDAWFQKVDLPEMIMDLRQGVGRLIRTKTDRGVVAILDSKLSTKRYKTTVLNSLGIPNITTNLTAVTKALNNLARARTE